MIRIFISSVQREFAEERMALRDYLRGDPLMRRFFDVFLFENVPAADRRADDIYLDEVAAVTCSSDCSAMNTERKMQGDYRRPIGNLAWHPNFISIG